MTILYDLAAAETRVIVTISKWGNSLGLRIPRGLAEDAHLNEGTAVDVRLERGKIVIEAVKEPTLEQLLARVTDANIHGDAFDTSAIGREAL